MTKAFPEAMVDDFAQLLANPLGLPDPNDEHVITAAVKTQAQASSPGTSLIFLPNCWAD